MTGRYFVALQGDRIVGFGRDKESAVLFYSGSPAPIVVECVAMPRVSVAGREVVVNGETVAYCHDAKTVARDLRRALRKGVTK